MKKVFKSLFFSYLRRKLNGLSQLIAKKSILPATIFTKKQIKKINNSFDAFWGLSHFSFDFKTPPRFSTFTLGTPFSLWTYYFPNKDEVLTLRTSYTIEPFTTQSDDGTLLSGTLFKKKKTSTHPSRTLIVFGGNGELYKIGSAAWVFKLLQNAPIDFDIVMFDLRECGNSEGEANAKGLILDGKAIYEYVKTTLNVDENSIDLCGFSLGGALATLVKSYYPHTQGALISNRSFQSLEKAVKEIFHPLGPNFAKWLGKTAWKLADHTSWELNPIEAWKRISSPKMVICHPKDPVVRHNASLEKGLDEYDLLDDCYHIQLRQKNPHLNIWNHHVQPLSFYNDQTGKDAEQQILKFLLKQSRESPESIKIS